MAISKKVLVAMSGGVDSSVAAAILISQGYQVSGVMLHLWSDDHEKKENACCTAESMQSAKSEAAHLGFPFQVIEAEDIFRSQVVQYFLDEYARGLTPNPCIICNRTIKWGFLLQEARKQGFDAVASGHYARIQCNEKEEFELWCGLDNKKDQSYVLFSLNQEQLAHCMFPLGWLKKSEVRQLATQFGLASAQQKESQDLCFIPEKDYRPFLIKYVPGAAQRGRIVDQTGKTLGEHEGLAFYTIGQRHGLHIPASEPYYVISKSYARNELICGFRSEFGTQTFTIGQVHWISPSFPDNPFHCWVKIRYHAAPAKAYITPITLPTKERRAFVQLEQTVRDITPGQFAVCYADGQERVLGGGVIETQNLASQNRVLGA